MRIRSSSLTVQNLGMMFKLDSNHGIYLSCEEEGEIVFPTDGAFKVQDYSKTYVVNGEPAAARPVSSFLLYLCAQFVWIHVHYQQQHVQLAMLLLAVSTV